MPESFNLQCKSSETHTLDYATLVCCIKLDQQTMNKLSIIFSRSHGETKFSRLKSEKSLLEERLEFQCDYNVRSEWLIKIFLAEFYQVFPVYKHVIKYKKNHYLYEKLCVV